jgi:hypothetical protein
MLKPSDTIRQMMGLVVVVVFNNNDAVAPHPRNGFQNIADKREIALAVALALNMLLPERTLDRLVTVINNEPLVPLNRL